MSSMEINHTRIYGVAHCAPLSEQPVTTKPNAFLGYIPETTSYPAAISANHEPNNQLKPIFAPNGYSAVQQDQATHTVDPVKQEQQLSKLASEIQELKSRVDELANQNQILLNQQVTHKSTERTPDLGEERKP